MPYKNKNKWNKWNQRRQALNRAALDELRAKACTDCGQQYPSYVMEFDHVPERGKKKKTVSELAGNRKVTSKTVQAELAKCDLVCANCHKVRTYFRMTATRSTACEPAGDGG